MLNNFSTEKIRLSDKRLDLLFSTKHEFVFAYNKAKKSSKQT